MFIRITQTKSRNTLLTIVWAFLIRQTIFYRGFDIKVAEIVTTKFYETISIRKLL